MNFVLDADMNLKENGELDMKTIAFNVSRDKSFVGAGMFYRKDNDIPSNVK